MKNSNELSKITSFGTIKEESNESDDCPELQDEGPSSLQDAMEDLNRQNLQPKLSSLTNNSKQIDRRPSAQSIQSLKLNKQQQMFTKSASIKSTQSLQLPQESQTLFHRYRNKGQGRRTNSRDRQSSTIAQMLMCDYWPVQ